MKIKRSTGFEPELLAALVEEAELTTEGNFNECVERICKTHLAERRSGSPMVALARRYCPAYAEMMEDRTRSLNQAIALAKLLEMFATGEIPIESKDWIRLDQKRTPKKKEAK